MTTILIQAATYEEARRCARELEIPFSSWTYLDRVEKIMGYDRSSDIRVIRVEGYTQHSNYEEITLWLRKKQIPTTDIIVKY